MVGEAQIKVKAIVATYRLLFEINNSLTQYADCLFKIEKTGFSIP